MNKKAEIAKSVSITGKFFLGIATLYVLLLLSPSIIVGQFKILSILLNPIFIFIAIGIFLIWVTSD